MTREDIANELADEGWCPDASECEYDDCDKWYVFTKRMFISDEAIDDYIKENPNEP